MPPTAIRPIRHDHSRSVENDSSVAEIIPFLTQEHSFDCAPGLEDGFAPNPTTTGPPDAFKSLNVTCSAIDDDLDCSCCYHTSPYFQSKSHSSWNPFRRFCGPRGVDHHKQRVSDKEHVSENGSRRKSRQATPLRRILRLLAVALMLLGIVEFIILACGLITAFFPEEADDSLDSSKPTGSFSSELGRWPTDFSADIQPVACASHNDYWRKEPLFSALNAGCTGVEADVWLFDQDLFVGHSTQSLSPERTLRSLYLDPLLKILSAQNSLTSFHPSSDLPPSGVFDTKPSQTLVLLIDFKNDGEEIWPYVSEQLQPFREKKYLTYFNGSSVIEGPITVVVTGNAPFKAVVANPHYRDIFFDAPLDLMDQLADSAIPVGASLPNGEATDAVRSTIPSTRSDNGQGQGHSGSAPTNPSIYSPANSYYASVDFRASIGFPWRGHLSPQQKEKLRKQIAGAHERGLKVRYWNVPSWPRGLRNYLWRVLVREGVDFLNVDDLRSATKGNWGWGRKGGPWWSGPWRFWPSTHT